DQAAMGNAIAVQMLRAELQLDLGIVFAPSDEAVSDELAVAGRGSKSIGHGAARCRRRAPLSSRLIRRTECALDEWDLQRMLVTCRAGDPDMVRYAGRVFGVAF